MAYQDPAKAMNPAMRIGRQITECYTFPGADEGRGAASEREHSTKWPSPTPA